MKTNILISDLVWIEGRCYRLNDSTAVSTLNQEHDLYEMDIPDLKEYEENDDNDDDYEIKMLGDNRCSTCFHVPKHYMGVIIGKRGAVKLRLEKDTRTEIKIPKHGQDGDVVVVGSSVANVKTARRRINMIVLSSRMKQRPTHFISIPLNNEEIINNFIKFKQLILQDYNSRGLEDSLFISPKKLHLTIGLLCLMDNEERQQASKLLEDAADEIIRPLLEQFQPLKVRVKGLSYMNDDPKNIDVLFAKVQEENAPNGLIQKLADDIVQYFHRAGFMNNTEHGRDHVKLHVTVLNSAYRGRTQTSHEEQPDTGRFQRESFDGTCILEHFSDYDFGVMDVTKIYLSQTHSQGEDGYYMNTSSVSCTR